MRYSFGPAYRASPLNFVLTGWVLRLSGAGLVAARGLSAAVGVLTVALLYLVGRKWFGERVGLFAGVIVALSMWHIYWSQVARHFVLVTLLVLVAIHGVLLVWRGRQYLVGSVLAGTMFLLGLFTHSSTGFVIAGIEAFVGVQWLLLYARGEPVWPRGGDRRHLTLLLALTAAMVIYLPSYFAVGKYLLGNIPPWNPPWNVFGSFAFYLPPWLAITALAGGVAMVRERDDTGWLLLSAIVSPIGLATLASVVTTSSAAYALPALLPVALLGGIALDRLTKHQPELSIAMRTLARGAALVVVAGLVMDVALYHSFYRGLKPRWSEAMAVVASGRQPGDRVVASEADVAGYYLGENNVLWPDHALSELEREPPCASSRPGGVWYVLYLNSIAALELPDKLADRLDQSGRLVDVFPSAYGPKLRTLGVYHEPAPDCGV